MVARRIAGKIIGSLGLPIVFAYGPEWGSENGQALSPVFQQPILDDLRAGAPQEAGLSPSVLDSVSMMMRRAVADSVFPGAVLLVARRGLVALHQAFGNLGYGDWAQPAPLNAIYDLASVTKVVATTTGCMILYERGLLDLDAPLQAYLPDFVGDKKEQVTIRHLLTHCAGLVPFRLYFKEKNSAEEILNTIMQERLEYLPGAKTAYSDLDFILLGKVVETLSEAALDKFCEENIFLPLRMKDTFFRPPASVLSRLAPTEFDSWRGRLAHGEVHDENAFALGGVSGHAGLFSTARDLAAFLQMLLNGGVYKSLRLLKPDTILEFTRRQNVAPGSSRALGWDTADGQNSAGKLVSARAFGHTGFTGTSVWVDPEQEMFVILLSNRVHPSRLNAKLLKFRPIIHDAIMRAVIH
jgi:CubicO group peptidase (beta-lactamase class C family)